MTQDNYGHLRKTTTIRIDDKLKDKLKSQAALHKCTLNREIEERLKVSLGGEPVYNDQLTQIIDRMDTITANTEALLKLLNVIVNDNLLKQGDD